VFTHIFSGLPLKYVFPVLILRSLTFNILFYLSLISWLVIGFPLSFFLSQKQFCRYMKMWCACALWLCKHIALIKMKAHGLEHIKGGPFIVAAKHQSLFENFALFYLLDDPVIILKRELMLIPFASWALRKMGMIPVNRESGHKEGRSLIHKAQTALHQGRSLLIFPEGTRRPPGAPPRYKMGLSLLYKTLQVPCLPVALNSGVYWPRRSFLRYPGTVQIIFLPPIPPGLHHKEAIAQIQDRIESASNALLSVETALSREG
jgi:1-acyl-sn-glycerol-3-phosphate acyltransferase